MGNLTEAPDRRLSEAEAGRAFLTTYDALLCSDCALDTETLIGDGRRWLAALTAVSVEESLAAWPEARCEECKKPFRRLRLIEGGGGDGS